MAANPLPAGEDLQNLAPADALSAHPPTLPPRKNTLVFLAVKLWRHI
jgi:hypothetical protein